MNREQNRKPEHAWISRNCDRKWWVFATFPGNIFTRAPRANMRGITMEPKSSENGGKYDHRRQKSELKVTFEVWKPIFLDWLKRGHCLGHSLICAATKLQNWMPFRASKQISGRHAIFLKGKVEYSFIRGNQGSKLCSCLFSRFCFRIKLSWIMAWALHLLHDLWLNWESEQFV